MSSDRKEASLSRTTVVAVGLLVGAWVAVGGCATIFNSERETLQVYSEPSGATVFVEDEPRGQTPTKIKVDPEQGVRLKVSKSGYGTVYEYVGRRIGGLWVVLDTLGGTIPALVDAITGGWYELNRETVNVYIE